MDFFQQYQHPEWQRKRLYVLERAGWSCEQCSKSDGPLHVHHKRYIKGRKVWEYDLENFEALCESCHAENHDAKDRINEVLAWIPGYMWEKAADLLEGWAQDFLPYAPKSESAEFNAGELAEVYTHLSRVDATHIKEQVDALRAKPAAPSGLVD